VLLSPLAWDGFLYAHATGGWWLMLCLYDYNKSHIKKSIARSVLAVNWVGCVPTGFLCVYSGTREQKDVGI